MLFMKIVEGIELQEVQVAYKPGPVVIVAFFELRLIQEYLL